MLGSGSLCPWLSGDKADKSMRSVEWGNGEATHLGVVLELLHAHSACSANHLHAGDNTVALLTVFEASSQDTLELQDADLRLELGDSVNKSLWRTQHESGQDIVLLDTLEPDSHLVTTLSQVNFIFLLAVDSGSLNALLIGHHDHVHALLDNTSLDLSLNHCTKITVLSIDGQHERSIDLTLKRLHTVEVLEQRRALPPGSVLLWNTGLDTLHLLSSNGQEVNVVLEVVTGTLEELSEFRCALRVSLLRPLNSGVVHLVNGNDELVDTLSLCKHSMLTSLSTTLETSLVLTLSGGNDQNTNIGLRGTSNHVGNVHLVARGIEDTVTTLLGFEESTSNLDSLSLCSLLLVQIHDP
ncbi:hypothetical protein HG531_005228 [Fusarium graminearum]|nr:hypothetical protein HG531_005228 [Fusarium graminearum]